ncbi:hypothetical protein, unlikely [Trypanosoma congolense IL3000]|uniref:Uncharacterized protein n=1 Tax=Trypanosoma congolense (strain IL3000) TaxID=1068625 RepID=F9WIT2_TRYCI|nr:hypothetical protein, unlikely [Trypanosoma congolense IL3000]
MLPPVPYPVETRRCVHGSRICEKEEQKKESEREKTIEEFKEGKQQIKWAPGVSLYLFSSSFPTSVCSSLFILSPRATDQQSEEKLTPIQTSSQTNKDYYYYYYSLTIKKKSSGVIWKRRKRKKKTMMNN